MFEPQLIFKQDKLVAAIVEPKLFQAFLAWHQQQKVSSFADAFAELRQICAEENYILETPARCSDRPNCGSFSRSRNSSYGSCGFDTTINTSTGFATTR
ncbi:MAG: hypothetical protein V7K98_19750 [Nostoc sp.]|uniref:hypothetical protein n=1 Tax=Nostoc sp. TaxID=1180 RepID=UPI002FFC3795